MSKEALVRAVKGMNDVRPEAADPFLDSVLWDHIQTTTRRVLESTGFRRVWMPVVEQTALFSRGIGAQTDIVSKEMYSFEDRGGRSLTLRPEGTAGCVRAYLEHNLGNTNPAQRWWYSGPMYRAERPQKGRYRQFYQIGAEVIGSAEPAADAELLGVLWRWCGELGLRDITLRINTLGDPESREVYRTALVAFLEKHLDALCESCNQRVHTNPLRTLDCKRPECKTVVSDAPDIADSLTDEAKASFDTVTELLTAQGVPYTRDRRLVRGLDYYTGVLFEMTTEALGSQDAILGGGRYDRLVEELGGKPTPATGFAAGVERLALLLAESGEFSKGRNGPHLYIVPMQGQHAAAFELAHALRCDGGWQVQVDVGECKLKQQMRRADRSRSHTALVLGESEWSTGRGRLKYLETATEVEVELNAAALGARLERVQHTGD